MLRSTEKKKLTEELNNYGVAIGEIHDPYSSHPIKLCLFRALLIFLTGYATVFGFSDSFSFTFNRPLLFGFIAFISLFMSILYINKLLFYAGYAVLLTIFCLAFIRYYLFATSGFQAITNIIREFYSDHFDLSVMRKSEEFYSDRYTTITIALMFASVFLIMLLNVTISRYMNLVETVFITFMFLEIPLYIGVKPPVYSIIILLGCYICVGILHAGTYSRTQISGRHAHEFFRYGWRNKKYYSYRGNTLSSGIILLFSVVAAILICGASQKLYSAPQDETVPNSFKEKCDNLLKTFVQTGFSGLFDRYDSTGGLSHGRLGGVSSVTPDFQTDLKVTFVPQNHETLYFPAFRGNTYLGSVWSSIMMDRNTGMTTDMSRNIQYDLVEKNNYGSWNERMLYPENRMIIENVGADESFLYEPYGSQRQNICYLLTKPFEDTPSTKEMVNFISPTLPVGSTVEVPYSLIDYSPENLASIGSLSDLYGPISNILFPVNPSRWLYPVTQGSITKDYDPSWFKNRDKTKNVSNEKETLFSMSAYFDGDECVGKALYDSAGNLQDIYTVKPGCEFVFDTNNYIEVKTSETGSQINIHHNIPFFLPEALDNVNIISSEQAENIAANSSDYSVKTSPEKETYFLSTDVTRAHYSVMTYPEEEIYIISTDVTLADYKNYVYNGYLQVPNDLREYLLDYCKEKDYLGLGDLFNNQGTIDINSTGYHNQSELALALCEAIRLDFFENYPYTLSPGTTPSSKDYVQYFLEYQKRGYCSHFASSAVMLLRTMGIPARYVEGYVMPPSSWDDAEHILVGEDPANWCNENYLAEHPDAKVYTAEISDFCAHAWIEVYLNEYGFVPYEMTPPSFEDEATTPLGLAGLLSRLVSVDLGFGGGGQPGEDQNVDVGHPVINDISASSGSIFKPVLIVLGLAAAVFLLLLLIRKLKKACLIRRYTSEASFDKLILIKYDDFVAFLKKKKLTSSDNPLPLETSELVASLFRAVQDDTEDSMPVSGNPVADEHPDIEQEASEQSNSDQIPSGQAASEPADPVQPASEQTASGQTSSEPAVSELCRAFIYMENVLYGGVKSDREEYDIFCDSLLKLQNRIKKLCKKIGKKA